MKIAIISDTHDNLANLKKAIAVIKKEKIKFLIHCGDIFKPETVKEVLKDFSGKAHFVLSDVDEEYFEGIEKDYFKNFPKLKIWKEFGKIKVGAKKIAFTHFPKTAMGLAISQKYDIVFYGHLHKPWKAKVKKTKLVNPGNIAGLFFKPTFAIYDSNINKLELKIL
jgi:hypothetical protein